jgi:Tfp pilus assembly protein PilF
MGILAGCAANREATTRPYQTVAADPHRDVERARDLNEQALKFLEAGKTAEAERKLKSALEADVTFGPAHNNLGRVYQGQGKFYLAAWEYQYAAQLMPERPEPKNNLGLVLESVGKLDEAIRSYHEAADLGPDDPRYLGNLARARVRHGDRGEDVRDLLARLVERETRPEWRQWAQQRLALFDHGKVAGQ